MKMNLDCFSFDRFRKIRVSCTTLPQVWRPTGDNDVVLARICAIKVLGKILRHALELGVAVLHPEGHHLSGHEAKGGRHSGSVLRPLRKGHLVMPVLVVEDT